jgi:PAS domain S-box-containing protein
VPQSSINAGAPLPPDEDERLVALYAAAIIDTGEEEFFEDIVDTVQSVVHAPIVLVSLVDEWRQWFKASRGLGVREMPRDRAFCAYTILSDGLLVVANARKDPRFSANPLVTGAPHIAAYAGAPIRLACGARLGAVCAIDTTPRDWTDAELAHLQRSARLVSRHIDTRRAHIEQHRQRFLERALEGSAARYRSVIGSMTEGMVVQGPSGAIIDCNRAACDILGLSEDEMFGRASVDPRWRATRPSGEDFPGEDHPAMVVLRTGAPQTGIIMGIRTPDDEQRWLSINAYPIRNGEDQIVRQSVTVFRRLDAREVERLVAEGLFR